MVHDPALAKPAATHGRHVRTRGGLDLDEQLLTPGEVAKLFRVDPKTVTRWAHAGKLSTVRTLGGHRRYRAVEIQALRDGAPALQQPTTNDGPLGEAA